MKELIHLRIVGYEVCIVANDGKSFLDILRKQKSDLPKIVLMDIQMRPMNGIDTTHSVTLEFPEIKVMAMTSVETANDITKMLAVGGRGYFLKCDATNELQIALDSLLNNGYFFSKSAFEMMSDPNWKSKFDFPEYVPLSKRESEFLRFACSDFTYKEIADKMGVSVYTVADYSKQTFKKLKVKSRQGLVIHAFLHELERYK